MRGEQGLTIHAILVYREIIRIKQRWQRVCGGCVWRTLITGMIYGPRVLLHVDLREPPTPFLGVAQHRSVHQKKFQSTAYFVLQKASPFIPDSIEWEIRLRAVWTPMVCADSLQYFQRSMFEILFSFRSHAPLHPLFLSLSEGGASLTRSVKRSSEINVLYHRPLDFKAF